MNKKIFFFFFLINTSQADDELCKFFKYCRGPSRNSSQSIPSASAAANLNPANISSVKGFGIETTYQSNNPLSFDLVTGNGKIGALVSPTLENSFFGNRSIEIDDLVLIRKTNKTQYKNNKLNFALGAKLIDKRDFNVDVGVSAKRNPDIKKINLGFGLSAKFSFLNFGAYFYQDDVKIDLKNYINPYNYIFYSSLYHSTTYQEKFSVETYTAGTKIKNLSLDFGVIKTRYKFYDDNTRIYIYSSSYNHKSFLFNFSIRREESPNLDFQQGKMVIQRKKYDAYYGVEYMANKSLVLGLQYNNFLLNEWSATLTLFF